MVGSIEWARRWHDAGASMISLAAEARILSMAATHAVKEIKAGILSIRALLLDHARPYTFRERK
jgi:hypothetical protein